MNDRPVIHVDSLQGRALKALRNQEPGAERRILEVLAGAVLDGDEIDASFQRVANAVMLKVMAQGRLPPKPKGRPKVEQGVGLSIAYRYLALRDAGVPFKDAVARTAAEFHKEERHIMRLVRLHKSWIGATIEERKRRRDWWVMCAEVRERFEPSEYEQACDDAASRAASRDLSGEIEQVFLSAVERAFATDKN